MARARDILKAKELVGKRYDYLNPAGFSWEPITIRRNARHRLWHVVFLKDERFDILWSRDIKIVDSSFDDIEWE